MNNDTRLIVVRGPCGAGKSTTASRLLDSPRPTALIEQDAYRFIFNVREGESYSKTVRQMIRDNVLCALANRFDVIVEGILSTRRYRDVFATLFHEHPRNNYAVFLRTHLRHRIRLSWSVHGSGSSPPWYRPHDVLGYDFERVIPEHSGVDDTVRVIRSAVAAKQTG
jgi:AAA domain